MSLPAIPLDNAVVQRLHDPEVAAAVDRLRGDLPIATCLPVLLEQGFCARSAVGMSDLQIAATAIHHSTVERPVVLVHYDRDFDHVVAVEPRLRSRWIVPPGSVA